MRRPVLGGLTLVPALVLALTAVGCDGSDPVADPTGSSTSAAATPSGSDSPSESVSGTPDPTLESTYAGVEPATGVALTGPITSISAPADWDGDPLTDKSGGNVNGPNMNATYNLLLDDVETSQLATSLDALAKQARQFNDSDPAPKRQPDVVLAGVPSYHLAGNDDIFGTYIDEFGLYTEGHSIVVRIATPRDLPLAERDAIVGSIMASFTLAS